MSILQVYSHDNEAIVSCLLVDEQGNEKNVVTISLEDNGVHVYKNLEGENNYYIIPPVARIDILIKEVIEQIAEELNVDNIIFRFGKQEQTEDLVLSEAWHNIEKLALAASKHAALANDVETKIIIGIVKFSNHLYASTVIRKEDTFPLMQIIFDKASNPPTIKIYNELGQILEERREKIDNLEEYIKSLVSSEDVAIVYREYLDDFPSPIEITTTEGTKYYVGIIFKYLAGFVPITSEFGDLQKKLDLRGKRKLAKLLRALLYLDKLSNEGGVEIVLPPSTISLPNLPLQIRKMKDKAEKILERRFSINKDDINYFGANDTILKEIEHNNLSNLKNNSGTSDLDVKIFPIAFVIVCGSKQEFDEYVGRIMSGPTSDGYEILDEFIKDNVSKFFIPDLMSLEEVLIIYNNIFSDLTEDGKHGE